MAEPFDPDAGARPDSGIFGLDHTRADAHLVLVPVPFDATVSYGCGTADGPAAILEASHQVDLFDIQTGRAWARGIHMLEESAAIRAANQKARDLAAPLIAQGGATAADAAVVAQVDALCAGVHAEVEAQVATILGEGKIPGVVGGDHSVSLGALRAVGAHRGEFGILHVDAHADLREAYEGFRYSHASIMHNVLAEVPAAQRLVQIGIRDLGERELRRAAEDPRVMLHHDQIWRTKLMSGAVFAGLCEEAITALPDHVYVSFDIDGLDPALCPGTGTPVPGGLSFAEACLLLQMLVESGRRIVGFDLCEVAPRGEDPWDGNVGARILYKLCGFSLL
ncbi:MAG: agmatinase family protein [Planctomycetes bacterium]|nr:agmatinase family protein [Planctomycetota bacterium]MCB9869718.1 agmatinase family protein [Planctomycetota bacterium]